MKYIASLSLAALLLAGLTPSTLAHPGNGRSVGTDGHPGKHLGWQKGQGNAWGRNARFGGGGGGCGSNFSGGNFSGGNFSGGNFFGGNQSGFGNDFNIRPIAQDNSRLISRAQRIQDQLAQGNLSPQQAADLQQRLDRIQSRLNGTNSYGYGTRQSRLQQLLNSGRLSPDQIARIQDRLAQLRSQSGGTGGGLGQYLGF